MIDDTTFNGISAALSTPFSTDGTIDHRRMSEHALDVIERGCSGVTVFGTTGEGASIGRDEKHGALDALIRSGVPAQSLIVGIAETAVADAIAAAETAFSFGVRRILLLPPFYFCAACQTGIAAWFANFSANVAKHDPKIALYHIPQVSGVPLAAETVRDLRANFGPIIAAVKDSSGNWDDTSAFLTLDGVEILVGDERTLARAAESGAAGSISGIANLYPERLATVFSDQTPDVGLDELVTEIVKHDVSPMIKALLAHQKGDPAWCQVRAPLTAANAVASGEIAPLLDAL